MSVKYKCVLSSDAGMRRLVWAPVDVAKQKINCVEKPCLKRAEFTPELDPVEPGF